MSAIGSTPVSYACAALGASVMCSCVSDDDVLDRICIAQRPFGSCFLLPCSSMQLAMKLLHLGMCTAKRTVYWHAMLSTTTALTTGCPSGSSLTVAGVPRHCKQKSQRGETPRGIRPRRLTLQRATRHSPSCSSSSHPTQSRFMLRSRSADVSIVDREADEPSG